MFCLSKTDRGAPDDERVSLLLILQEEDDTKENNNKDLLRIGAGLLNGFLGLLQAKIGIFRSILQNTVIVIVSFKTE